jgi:tryptophan synthase alpha chain
VSAPHERLSQIFTTCRTEKRAALVGYLPVGYPTVEKSIEAVTALVEGGCDLVEVGIPYSDPVMDGTTIQDAANVALAGGVHVRNVFPAVKAVTDAGGAAVVMTYWNLVLKYGVENFARDLAAAGGLGIITPDLIPDEAGEWIAASDKYGLGRIFLVSPSSTNERLAMTLDKCRGFVYATSTMGVTGARDSVDNRAPELVARVRTHSDIPVGVGLGVRNGAQAAEIAGYADGVIVGSALVSAAGQGRDALLELTRDLAKGVRSATVAP